MDIKRLMLVDGKLYIFSPNEKAEVGDISQCKYTGKYEILTENNITYMTGYYLWKPVELYIELNDKTGLCYRLAPNSSETIYSVHATKED